MDSNEIGWSKPPLLFANCNPSIGKFIKAETKLLSAFLNRWTCRRENIILFQSTCRRFHNQHRHFIYFKAAMSVMRSFRRIEICPSIAGLTRFCKQTQESCTASQCLSLRLLEHFMRCLLKLHERLTVLVLNVEKCARLCERHLETGHFIKICLLLLCCLARLRSEAMSDLRALERVYDSMYAIRTRHPEYSINAGDMHHFLPLVKNIERFSTQLPEADSRGPGSKDTVHNQHNYLSPRLHYCETRAKTHSTPNSFQNTPRQTRPTMNKNVKRAKREREDKQALISFFNKREKRNKKFDLLDLLK